MNNKQSSAPIRRRLLFEKTKGRYASYLRSPNACALDTGRVSGPFLSPALLDQIYFQLWNRGIWCVQRRFFGARMLMLFWQNGAECEFGG